MRLQPGQAMFQCGGQGGCNMLAEVEWPTDTDGIWGALAERPVPSTRNWYPPSHTEALRLGLAHGQTAADLREETRWYESQGLV